MTQAFSVWTKDTSESWLARNSGCSDRLLLHGVPEQQAILNRAALADMYGDTNVEVHPSSSPPPAGSVGRD